MSSQLLEVLRRDGVAVLPQQMGKQELAELIAHMDERPVWPAHVATKSKVPDFPNGSKLMKQARTDGEWSAFAPTMETLVTAPHWLECAIAIYPMVKEHFGEQPLLYSLNCFWMQPGTQGYTETHYWHRDGDDRKQFGLFMFGTDVLEPNDGFHMYQRGTYTQASGTEDNDPPPSEVVTISGFAGTMFVEEPWGVHIGVPPKSKPRLFVWARFGVSDPPPAYQWDLLQPVSRELIGYRYPTDPEIQHAIHLVVS